MGVSWPGAKEDEGERRLDVAELIDTIHIP
jgi:hypothetical protein